MSFRWLFTSSRYYPLLFCTSLAAGLIQKFPKYAKGWETHFKALLECYLIEHVVFNANENDLSRTKCSFEGGVVCRLFQISGKTWYHRYTLGQILQFTRLVHALQQCCCAWNESNIVHTSGPICLGGLNSCETPHSLFEIVDTQTPLTIPFVPALFKALVSRRKPNAMTILLHCLSRWFSSATSSKQQTLAQPKYMGHLWTGLQHNGAKSPFIVALSQGNWSNEGYIK